MFILPELHDSYKSHVSIGTSHLRDKKVAVVGIAKNVGDTLYNCLNQLKIKCRKLSCFIYENNSADNTKDLIKHYSETSHHFDNFTFLSEDIDLYGYEADKQNNSRSPKRLQVLSYARNICKDFIKNTYSDYDYVIVVDMDFTHFLLNGIYNSFGWISENIDSIDAMAGFSYVKVYRPNPDNPSITEEHLSNYDSWAYRHTWWEDLSKRYILKKDNPFTLDPMLWFAVWSPLIGSKPFKVNSAFGGACIYKTSKYLIGQYDDYDCEHVTFHRSINYESDNFNLYVNPSQLMMLN